MTDKKNNNISPSRPKSIIKIEPDYDAFLWDVGGDYMVAILLDELYDQCGKPISFPAIEDWAKEIHPIVIAAATDEPYEKDWADYHKRGLDLAHRLRQMLSNDFELWYYAPFEDKSGIIPKPILIYPKIEAVRT